MLMHSYCLCNYKKMYFEIQGIIHSYWNYYVSKRIGDMKNWFIVTKLDIKGLEVQKGDILRYLLNGPSVLL